jgi:hypothetical protein
VKQLLVPIALALLLQFGRATCGLAQVPSITVDGHELVNVSQVAGEAGWKAEHPDDSGLLVLCRNTDAAICVPVRLAEVPHQVIDGELYVDAATLTQVIGVRIRIRDNKITVTDTSPAVADSPAVPAYHADWGANRGFRPGQTVPDIPLYDMDGNEVRFSRYLGKQYIIYCWASW